MNMKLLAVDVSGDDPSFPFYVYLYRDIRKGKDAAPLYVGKGCDTHKKRNASRARRHWSRPSQNPFLLAVFAKIRAAKLTPRLEIVGRFHTEQEAFDRECLLIAQYGRRNTGTGSLCNLTDGGEGPSGTVVSAETREKLRVTSTRAKADPDVRRQIAAQSKLMHADPEFVARRAAALRAAMATPEHKAIRSAFMREVHARPGDRERRCATLRATLAAATAREIKSERSKSSQARPEVKERHAAALRNRWASDEEKKKQSERMRHMHQNPEIKARHLAAVRASADKRRAAKLSGVV